MDAIWECMNIASRIAKQVENTETLVPKNQRAAVTTVAGL